MYINTVTSEYPISEADIKALFPNVSFAIPFVAPEPYIYVFPAPAVYDPLTHTVAPTAPELTVLGHYEQRWIATAISPETILANAETARIAAIPLSVSPRQIRQALTAANLRATVEAAIAVGDQDTKDWYEFSTAFERNHPRVAAMGTALGVSVLDMDNLWTLAGSL